MRSVRWLMAVALVLGVLAGDASAFVVDNAQGGGDDAVLSDVDRGMPSGDMFPNHDPDYVILNLTNNAYGDDQAFPNGYYFSYPSFNSTGTKVAVAARNKIGGVLQVTEVWVMDYDKVSQTISNFQKITTTGGTGDISYNTMVSWSRANPNLLMFLEIHIASANVVKSYNASTASFATIYDPALDTNGMDATNPAFFGQYDDRIVVGSGYNTGNDRILLFNGTYPSTTISSPNKNLDSSANYGGDRVTYYSTQALYAQGSIYSQYSGGSWTENTSGFGDPALRAVPGYWAAYSGKSDDMILSLRSDLGFTATALGLYSSDGLLVSDLLGNGGTDFKFCYSNHNWEGPAGEIVFKAERFTHAGYGNDLFIAMGHPDEVWVDDSWTGPSDCGGHAWGYDAFASVNGALGVVADGGTVHVGPGLYTERVVIDRPLTLLGATAAVNKNGYTVPALYGWNTAVESVINYPDPTGQGVDQVAVDILSDNVTFKGFVVQVLNARVGSDHLLRLNAQIAGGTGTYLSNIVVENNVLGPVTNTVSQDGTYGRMGLYLASPTYPANRQGIRYSHIAGNKIFDTRGNGDNVFIWGAAEAYASVQNADYTGTVIENNEIYGSHRSGIEIAGGVSNLTIRNNTIRNNSSTNGGSSDANLKYGSGIVVIRMGADKMSPTARGCDHLTVQGNQIYGNEKNGMYLGPINSDFSVLNNLIRNNGWDGLRVDLSELYYGGTWPVYGRTSNIAVGRNSITGNGLFGSAVVGTPTNGFVLGSTYNWWGAANGPGGVGPGSGDEVSNYVGYDPWIGKTGGENVVCDPDPLILKVGSTTGQVAVKYLGGGSGLVFGYSVTVSWDAGKVSLTGITEGGLLKDAAPTRFFVTGSGNTRTIDCSTLNAVANPGVTGPGTMFTLGFSAVGYGESPVDVGILAFRDRTNADLTGFYENDGLIKVDIVRPTITAVHISNEEPDVSDDWVKNGDSVKLTATVADDDPDFDETNIWADLGDLGGGGAENPDSYNPVTDEAVWNAWTAAGTPSAGTLTVTVDATDPIGNTAVQGSDDIEADNVKPTAVTGLDAVPGHDKCDLSWTMGTDDHLAGVTVRRTTVPGDYPQYPAFKAAWPTNEAEALYPATHSAGVEVYSGLATIATDADTTRSIHYYQAFCYDEARNYGEAAATARDLATNYWLGDVANTMDHWARDGRVTVNDINKLAGQYGTTFPAPYWDRCDVGPTVHPTGSRLGVPKPDRSIQFEDLMMFAMNYGAVAPKIVPFLPAPSDEALALSLEALTTSPEGEVQVALRLAGNVGEVKGISTVITYDATQLEFVSARLSDAMVSPLADMFFWSGLRDGKVQVDLAVLGTDVAIGGSGDVAVLTFRTLGGEYALGFDEALIRGVENEELTGELEGLESRPEVPTVFRLSQNVPNPFNPKTVVAYEVPQVSEVTIRVYDVTGRLVTTLVDGTVEPGRYAVVWDGTGSSGESVGSGVYFCVMDTPAYHATNKMMLLK
jgi:hypothetical protein